MQVLWTSQKVKEDIKVDGSCTGTNKPKYWQLISDPSLTLPVPDSSSHLRPPASTKTGIKRPHGTIYTLRRDNPPMWFRLITSCWREILMFKSLTPSYKCHLLTDQAKKQRKKKNPFHRTAVGIIIRTSAVFLRDANLLRNEHLLYTCL